MLNFALKVTPDKRIWAPAYEKNTRKILSYDDMILSEGIRRVSKNQCLGLTPRCKT